VWAGVDSAWEQEKLEARKMLENAAESHTSGARFVGWRVVQDTFAFENFTNLHNPLGFTGCTILVNPKRIGGK
jgi:hypothetical protein